MINKTGIREYLQISGPAVGVVNDTDYLVRQVMFGQGDILFAYTDGITDTANPAGELFNVKEFIPLLSEPRPIHALLELFQERIDDHAAGAKQFDDITMLAVRRKN
jgi:sigma-B regulation protein RsbU (phosphoserine phosphatase)